jgi:hypothetical protein
VAALQLNSLSLASNNMGDGQHGEMEDDAINQVRDPMDIKESNPPHLEEEGKNEEHDNVHTKVMTIY